MTHSIGTSSLYSSFVYLVQSYCLTFVIFSAFATATEYVNITIKAPIGTRVRGNGNLICTPTQWNDVLLFLLGNYFAHAVTVVSKPGEPSRDLFFRTFVALLFPHTGMHDGLKAITRHPIFQSNPLQRAARAGALCMLVRSSQWKPCVGDAIHGIKFTDKEVSKLKAGSAALRNNQALTPAADDRMKQWLRLPKTTGSKPEHDSPLQLESQSNHAANSALPVLTYRCFYSKLRFDDEDLVKVPALYEVDGLIGKSEEYELVFVPEEADVIPTPLKTETETETETDYPATLSASYGFAKPLVAAFQTIYSSVTLYRARADQLTDYGYAAFGLTVAPYAVMSIVNFIGNMLTPDYAALHLVRSSDLDEAVRRGKQRDTTVGELKTGPIDTKTWIGTIQGVYPASNDYDMNFERVQASGTSTSENSFKARIHIDENASDKGFLAETMLQKVHRRSPMKYWPVRFALKTIVVLAPLIINGAISGFQPGESTSAERGWTMSWLIVGITSCAGLVYIFTIIYLKEEDHLRVKWKNSASVARLVVFMLACGAPAIGGMITVIQMFLQFGSCARIW